MHGQFLVLIVLPSDDENRRRDLLQNSRREDGSTFDLFDGLARLRLWGTGGEWKYLRNGRLVFSSAFSKWDGRVDQVPSVGEAV